MEGRAAFAAAYGLAAVEPPIYTLLADVSTPVQLVEVPFHLRGDLHLVAADRDGRRLYEVVR